MQKRGKKAQAAMEFLMTYGWAILIVLIVIAALFFLGVFSPSIQNTCTISAPFICNDIAIGEGYIVVVLSASNIQSGSVTEITVNSQVCPNLVGQLFSDRTNKVICTGINLQKGDKAQVNFKVNYMSKIGGLSHDVKGSGSGKVEKQNGVFLEGAAFNRGFGCGPFTTGSVPIVGSCDNNCGGVCSSNSYLEYDTSTKSGENYITVLKVGDYLHNCQDKLMMSVYANNNLIGNWQGSGINNWAYPSFPFTATSTLTTIRVMEDNDACCGCGNTCNLQCTPLAGDLNLYVDDLTLI